MDTLYACYQGVLRTSIIQGQVWYSEMYDKFVERNEVGGLTFHGGYLPSDHFPINKRVEGPNPNQVFLRVCREHDRNFEHWDVHFYQGSFNQLRTKCTKMTMGCVSAEPFQRGSKTSSLTASQKYSSQSRSFSVTWPHASDGWIGECESSSEMYSTALPNP